MKVALLQCDDVLEKFQPEYGNYPDMVQAMFDGVEEVLEFEIFNCQKCEFPEDIDVYDFFITTGSKASAYDDLIWVRCLIDFVRLLDRNQKKLIGICFGHQVIALARGGTVEKSDKGWGVGIAKNELVDRPEWMPDAGNEFNVLVSHQDQVTRLPKGARVLAQSAFCPNFVVQWDDHFLGIQGHPEWSSGYSRSLLNDRRKIIPAERVESAICSLVDQPDNALIVEWILGFVKN